MFTLYCPDALSTELIQHGTLLEVLKGKDLHFDCHQMLWMHEVCVHTIGIKKKKKKR